jgi:polar amino acid transport system permease protein
MLHYDFDWLMLTRPALRTLLIQGLGYTIVVALASSVLSFALGAALAMARFWPTGWLTHAARAWVEIVRNIPGLFWILFFYFALPELLPFGSVLHAWPHYALVAATLGLALDNGAYLSDILLNGMTKIPSGQRDAAASCGLSLWKECLWLLCPQSLRSMAPALTNRMVHNFKNTSLCIAIALPELTWATQQIESITFKSLEVTLVATLIYAFGSFLIVALMKRILGHTSSLSSQSDRAHGF